jgi:hypothetical protein
MREKSRKKIPSQQHQMIGLVRSPKVAPSASVARRGREGEGEGEEIVGPGRGAGSNDKATGRRHGVWQHMSRTLKAPSARSWSAMCVLSKRESFSMQNCAVAVTNCSELLASSGL